jgi:hypothetical protein
MEKRWRSLARAARLALVCIALLALLLAALSGRGLEAVPLLAFALCLIEVLAPLPRPEPAAAAPGSKRLPSARSPPCPA